MLNISAKIRNRYRAACLQHFISTASCSQRQSKAKEKLLYYVISVTADVNYGHHRGQGREKRTLFHLGLPGAQWAEAPSVASRLRRALAQGKAAVEDHGPCQMVSTACG